MGPAGGPPPRSALRVPGWFPLPRLVACQRRRLGGRWGGGKGRRQRGASGPPVSGRCCFSFFLKRPNGRGATSGGGNRRRRGGKCSPLGRRSPPAHRHRCLRRDRSAGLPRGPRVCVGGRVRRRPPHAAAPHLSPTPGSRGGGERIKWPAATGWGGCERSLLGRRPPVVSCRCGSVGERVRGGLRRQGAGTPSEVVTPRSGALVHTPRLCSRSLALQAVGAEQRHPSSLRFAPASIAHGSDPPKSNHSHRDDVDVATETLTHLALHVILPHRAPPSRRHRPLPVRQGPLKRKPP